MPKPRFVLFLAALVIAACSATEPVAKPAPAPVAAPVANGVAAPAGAPKSLKAAMEGIEEDWKAIEKAIETGALGDGKALGAAAERCAAVMKLAYDPFEDREVPQFATYAREAEAALKAFGAAAAKGAAGEVKELGKTLQSQHCARCHDAVEKVHG